MVAAVERFGRVDILVHGAGVGVHKEIVDMSERSGIFRSTSSSEGRSS